MEQELVSMEWELGWMGFEMDGWDLGLMGWADGIWDGWDFVPHGMGICVTQLEASRSLGLVIPAAIPSLCSQEGSVASGRDGAVELTAFRASGAAFPGKDPEQGGVSTAPTPGTPTPSHRREDPKWDKAPEKALWKEIPWILLCH